MTGGRRIVRTALVACWLILSLGCESAKIRIHLNDGSRLYKAHKFEEAIAEYQKILRIAPDHWNANYLTAISYMALYHPGSTHPTDLEFASRAIAAFEKTMKLEAPNTEERDKVRTYYLGLLTTTNRTDAAVAYLEQLLEEDPKDQDVLSQLASLYARKGDFENAVRLFEKRAQDAQGDKEAWYSLGVLYWERSNKGAAVLPIEERAAVIEKGIAAFDRALEIDPRYFEALSYINLIYREKAQVLSAEGKHVEAQEAFQTAENYRAKAMEIRGAKEASTPGA